MPDSSVPKILVVDDEPEICWIIKKILTEREWEVHTAFSGEQGMDLAAKINPDLTFLDIKLPGIDGLEVLQRLKAVNASLPVIMLSAFDNLSMAVRAMKLGAYDYISKPLNIDELLITMKNALKTRQLISEVDSLKNQIQRKNREKLIWSCSGMQKVMEMVDRITRYDVSVLVRGESGTGKELIAEYIHAHSPRANRPLISIDCTALPETLMESELFGYEKGAFTGANESKPGRFEQAQGGTLFLDEIGNLPASMQIKLLRVLQERRIQRLGGKREIEIDVRLLSATNLDLENAIQRGTFRDDLYHRLNEFTVQLPPLRERREDIEVLTAHFLDLFNRQFEKNIKSLTPEAMAWMLNYSWPGNVRELMNRMKRAVIMSSDIIEVGHFPLESNPPSPAAMAAATRDIRPLREICQEASRRVERETISRVLQETRWNKVKTARLLKINYKTLFNKMRELGI